MGAIWETLEKHIDVRSSPSTSDFYIGNVAPHAQHCGPNRIRRGGDSIVPRSNVSDNLAVRSVNAVNIKTTGDPQAEFYR